MIMKKQLAMRLHAIYVALVETYFLHRSNRTMLSEVHKKYVFVSIGTYFHFGWCTSPVGDLKFDGIKTL